MIELQLQHLFAVEQPQPGGIGVGIDVAGGRIPLGDAVPTALARAISSSSTMASRRSLSQAARRFSSAIPLNIPISSSGPAG